MRREGRRNAKKGGMGKQARYYRILREEGERRKETKEAREGESKTGRERTILVGEMLWERGDKGGGERAKKYQKRRSTRGIGG